MDLTVQSGGFGDADRLAGWFASSHVQALLLDLERYALGSDIDQCPILEALFQDADLARKFAEGFASASLAELKAGASLQLLFRKVPGETQVVIARSERTQLMLIGYDGAALARQPDPDTVVFSPFEFISHFIGGSGTLERVSNQHAANAHASLRRELCALDHGSRFRALGLKEALRMVDAEPGLIELRLRRRFVARTPDRHYDLSSGRLLVEQPSCPREARLRLVMSAIASMGRKDAMAYLCTAAKGRGSSELRVQALQHLQALDRRVVKAVFAEIAADPVDPLARWATGMLKSAAGPVELRKPFATPGKSLAREQQPWFV